MVRPAQGTPRQEAGLPGVGVCEPLRVREGLIIGGDKFVASFLKEKHEIK